MLYGRMKRSCVAQDWGLSLSISLSPLPSGKKCRMINGKASVYDYCTLALPTPSCIFNAGGGESRDYDCCALTMPTPSCTYNSGGGGGSITGSLELSLSPPSLNVDKGQPFAWEEAGSGGSTTAVVVEAPATTTLDGEAVVPASPPTSSSSTDLVINTVDIDELVGQLAPPRPGTTWQEKARLLNGTAPLRVMEKRLFSTDVSRDHARFLFTSKGDQEGKPPHRPPHQDQSQTKMRERGPRTLLDTLTEAEKEAARADGGLPLLLLDRWGNEHGGNKLKFWKSNHSYVILGNWPSFFRLGELESGDVVQVHVFRVLMQQAPVATNASTAAGPDPVPSDQAAAIDPPPPQGGRPCLLAVVICSQVAVEEEERRRGERPEDKEARRCLQNLDPAKPRRKKRTGEEVARD